VLLLTSLFSLKITWNVAFMMAQMLNTDIERMVYDRVKEALCHPDNVLGAAVLLASLAIPEDEPGAHFDWFLNRCLPAAAPWLKPILVQEPAVGTGVMILAHAAASPEWAVRNYLIRYHGQDIDPLMVACTSITDAVWHQHLLTATGGSGAGSVAGPAATFRKWASSDRTIPG
jgi:hypothetical protein